MFACEVSIYQRFLCPWETSRLSLAAGGQGDVKVCEVGCVCVCVCVCVRSCRCHDS